MDSCQGNPSPSDPMESVCRHFRPHHQQYFAVYLLSLSRTHSRQSDGLLPRQPVSIGSDGVRLPTFSTDSTAIFCCILTKSLANWLAAVRWTLATATRLHRKRWSLFADLFHPPLNYSLLIFTKSLANWIPVSLVAHVLRPSDSVWMYWTPLIWVRKTTKTEGWWGWTFTPKNCMGVISFLS